MPVRHVSSCELLCSGLFVVWSWGGGASVCVGEISSLLSSVGQEELAILRRQLEGKDGEMLRLPDETGFKAIASSSADPTERGGKDSSITSVTEYEHADALTHMFNLTLYD